MPLLESVGSISARAYGLNSYSVESAWKSIQTITLASDNSFIDLSSIPQTYKHLKIIAIIRGTAGLNNIAIRLNGDSGASWQRGFLGTEGSTVNGGTYTSGGTFDWVYGTNNTSMRMINEIIIPNYTDTNKWKNVDIFVHGHHNSTSNYNNMIIQYGAGHWQNTAAVTSVTITNAAISAGSTFQLYGLEG